MLSIWYWALQRTAQYFSEIYTLIHSYSIHIFVLVRKYKNVENSRMNHSDLKIVWNVTYGPFIAASLRSCFIMENLLLISPSLSLVSHAQKVGRPLLTVWMQTTEICIWTEEDYPLLLCTIFPFFFFCTSSSHRLLYLFMVRTLSYSGLLCYAIFLYISLYISLCIQ